MTDPKRIATDDVPAFLEEGYQIVDVRTEGEYAGGHPAGAFNVPVMHAAEGGMQPNPDFVAVMKSRFSTDTPLLLSCRSGGRSAKAAQLLASEGYEKLVDLRPGWGGRRNAFGELEEPGWSQSDLPTETETEGRSYADLRAATDSSA